ncbi:hypothetical protein BDK51DRAFT_52248 [Blyttiomyces helicus]|uniref:Uncharacterized protein n=1 Tax=Blyttiomyces helicus TaxID=388810 RepID=A0A4P9WNG4_9FUNG|nr:hypothetical protein BDK51DRAFT_52248 [Blyttiomyces helicus]|eukprot:RKO94494.1 hypothetical protein BDK51DRAFT_52248 [Blyttiomyces helicus]
MEPLPDSDLQDIPPLLICEHVLTVYQNILASIKPLTLWVPGHASTGETEILCCIFLVFESITGPWMYQPVSFLPTTAVPLHSITLHKCIGGQSKRNPTNPSKGMPYATCYVFIDEAQSAPTDLIRDIHGAFRFSLRVDNWLGKASMIFIWDFLQLLPVFKNHSLAAEPPYQGATEGYQTILSTLHSFQSIINPIKFTLVYLQHHKRFIQLAYNEESHQLHESPLVQYPDHHTAQYAIDFYTTDEYMYGANIHIPNLPTTTALLCDVPNLSINQYPSSFTCMQLFAEQTVWDPCELPLPSTPGLNLIVKYFLAGLVNADLKHKPIKVSTSKTHLPSSFQ